MHKLGDPKAITALDNRADGGGGVGGGDGREDFIVEGDPPTSPMATAESMNMT